MLSSKSNYFIVLEHEPENRQYILGKCSIVELYPQIDILSVMIASTNRVRYFIDMNYKYFYLL